MLVYGDRSRRVDPHAVLAGLEAEESDGACSRLERHARLCGALIAAGGLAQGLADAAFHARGGIDGRSPAADLAQAITSAFATRVVGSWRSGFKLTPPIDANLFARTRVGMGADPVEVRTCEGYAFYAVYPELYAEAAAQLGNEVRVIGLRSIGTSLAAAGAAGCGARMPLTLRPQGDPFAREIRVDAGLAAELSTPAGGGWAVADEGPGLSGSSFAAAGALLQAHGAAPERIAYLPSHGGGPGREAPPASRAAWRSARRLHHDFDDAIRPRLVAWAERWVGPALAPLQDLSAGRWRAHVPAGLSEAPAWPAQERRKYLLHTEEGAFLLKFTGLGSEGEVKLARARALHARGFAAEPKGLVHGFLVERWADTPPVRPGLDDLVAYLAFRTRLTSPQPGADTEGLRAMMQRNFALAGLPCVAELSARLPGARRGAPMATDGRLHAWEWRAGPEGRPIKTDALDHAQAHDLIGAQDLAWDIAGATVEFALSEHEGEHLRAALERETGAPLDPRRIAFQTLAYLAFQIGWWTLAGSPEVARYEGLARRWTPA